MLQFALNRMTMPSMPLQNMMQLAKEIGCAGIELRNDVALGLFDDFSPDQASLQAAELGLQVHALAEVSAFNNMTQQMLKQAIELMDSAAACGAHAIILVPQIGGEVSKTALANSLLALQPELEKRELIGLIEPIGFATSTLRLKSQAIAAIDATQTADRFMLVHDTFHHYLVDEPICAERTALVHVSGVVNHGAAKSKLIDEHRGLIDASDRLENIAQLRQLQAQGFAGPISFEAFSPETHAIADPKAALLASKSFIETACRDIAA